jgi:hypothetical protein
LLDELKILETLEKELEKKKWLTKPPEGGLKNNRLWI